MTFTPQISLGELVCVIAYYRDSIVCNGIFIEECKYGMYFKVLDNNGEIREFDTVYYYLETLEKDD